MKQFVKGLVLLVAVQSLAGCAYVKGKKAIVKNRDMAYLEVHEVKNLKLPQDLQQANIRDELIIPPATQTWDKQPPDLTPPGSLAAQIRSGQIDPKTLTQKDPHKPGKSFWSRWF